MLRRVALVRTGVSEELIAYIMRMKRFGELGKTLALTSNYQLAPKLYVFRNVGSSRAPRSYIPEDGITL
jgi:hypothetical protein